MKLSCLCLQNKLDDITSTCLSSWLNLNYTIILYTYVNILDFKNNNTICNDSRIQIMDAANILPWEETFMNSIYLRYLFKFTLLLKHESICLLDMDLFLLKQLPLGNYISGQGCYSSRPYKANTVVISQIKPVIDWNNLIDLLKTKKKIMCRFVKSFEDEMHNKYFNIIKPSIDFCPIHEPFTNTIYEEKDISGTRFGIKINNFESITINSIGICLWQNTFYKKKIIIKEECIFKQLKETTKNYFNYKICIPTYKRSELLFQKTFKLINTYNIPRKSINIFVSDEEDLEEYKSIFKNINIVLVPDNFKGIGAVRSFITNDWSDDRDRIVMMDDDLEYFKLEDNSHMNLKKLIVDFFDKLDETELNFAGLPLCNNVFFFKNNWTTTLKYCSGAFQCIKIDKNKLKLSTPYRHFEDYYFNLAYFHRDGGILRWNACSPVTKNYNINGGIAQQCGSMEKRLEVSDKVADEIINEFGSQAVSKYHKKKSARGPACLNLRLNHNLKL